VKRRPVVTVQYPDGHRLRDHFHRSEADSGSAEDLHAALDTILSDPDGTRRGVVQKKTFKGHTPAKRGDGEVIPGIAAAVT
jgi:hypothetical protein